MSRRLRHMPSRGARRQRRASGGAQDRQTGPQGQAGGMAVPAYGAGRRTQPRARRRPRAVVIALVVAVLVIAAVALYPLVR